MNGRETSVLKLGMQKVEESNKSFLYLLLKPHVLIHVGGPGSQMPCDPQQLSVYSSPVTCGQP